MKLNKTLRLLLLVSLFSGLNFGVLAAAENHVSKAAHSSNGYHCRNCKEDNYDRSDYDDADYHGRGDGGHTSNTDNYYCEDCYTVGE